MKMAWRSLSLVVVFIAGFLVPSMVSAGDVFINPKFPVKGDNGGPVLSPPLIGALDECSRHVFVSSFVPKATVKVYLNGGMTPVATATPLFGFDALTLATPVSFGDKLTATQTVNGTVSALSNPPVLVGHLPSVLPTPFVSHQIYQCGRIVPVSKLISGVGVKVNDATSGTAIGSGFTPNQWGSDWDPVFTNSLVAGHEIDAEQDGCGSEKSHLSPSVKVLPEPAPLLRPVLDTPIVGNDTVTANALYPGALLQVFDHTTAIASGYATGTTNWTHVNPPIAASSLIAARQSLCHHSPLSKAQKPTTHLSAPLLVGPICPNQPSVTVRNSTVNATVVLFRNSGEAGYAGATPGDLMMTIAPPLAFQVGDHVSVLQYIKNIISPVSNQVVVNCAKQNVVTQHNDNARQGAQLAESTLTPANVSGAHFGFLYDRHVLGTLLAQPLYVHGVRTSSGIKNVIYLATAQDVVYAFDADDQSADTTTTVSIPTDAGPISVPESTKYLWRRSLGTPHVGDICAETVPGVVGVTSTPVIDVSSGTMYVVSREQRNEAALGNDHLHAINIEDGSDLRSVTIGGTDSVHGLTFDPNVQRQRPGLLLLNGTVYLGYGTYTCDQGHYRGWVLGYRATDFAPAGIFTTSQSASERGTGIWASGNGLAGANDGSIFLQTGNDIDPIGGTPAPVALLGDSFVKLHGDGTSLTLASHYQPAEASNYKQGDTDLGAGGPMLLPGGKLIGGGKDGKFFVLSQNDLTASPTSFQAFFNTFHVGPTPYPYNTPAVYPTLCPPAGVFGVANEDQPCYIPVAQYKNGESFGPNIHAGPVFWQDTGTHAFVYKMSEKDYLKSFDYDITAGTVSSTPAHIANVRPQRDGMPGGFSSISANARKNGIVWTVVQQANSMMGDQHPALLYANDASTLAELWNNGDWQTALAKFTAPTIADGKVVLASEGLFQVYGLTQAFPKHLRDYPIPEAISRKWLNSGGAYGMLGKPISDVIRDDRGGAHQDFAKVVADGGYGQVSVSPSVQIKNASEDIHEKGVPEKIVSSIYFGPKIGPHFVVGEIRRLWLAHGGVAKLGYPITDEIPTPDGFGLMTRFEHGLITWHRDQAARIEPNPVSPNL